ncbi:MAG: hypothetical protein EXS13_15155 [Planctomycetes bacterium]|nr:hypothetical protein [Planctomycetota bacterium]
MARSPSIAATESALFGAIALCGFAAFHAGAVAPTHAVRSDDRPEWKNPYFPECKWKLWRKDEEAVTDARVFVPPATAPPSSIVLPLDAKRLWPVAKPAKGRFLELSNARSKEFAGTWDDVYASWSGTHGWVRDRWAAPLGSAVAGDKAVAGDEAVGIASAIIAVVDQAPMESHSKLGINYYHQSTTGMAHTITNSVIPPNTLAYERLYFSSGLICSPCHLSWIDEGAANAAFTTDLYLTLMPTLFNSVGSSDSETMAITKWVIAGAYLKPELKLRLKESGLYASAMLWLWKSCLPIEADYDEEWRHRVAYAAVGDRFAFPGGYGAAGIERGDICLAYHEYDDAEHLRRMIDAARELDVAPPEAVVNLLEQQGGTKHLALKKTIGVLQKPGEEVVLRVSAEESFDLDERPLALRWKLLYGNRRTQVERDGDAPVWTIRVPWDETLPEGRTTLLLIANNGVHDGNPAAVTIYRQRGELPPSGGGYNDYTYDTKFSNRRPIIVGLQDITVKPGDTLTLPIRAIDPEGQPLRFTKRLGQPGEFDGNVFTWKVPSKEPPGARALTVICSDGTAGNSYEAQTIALQVKQKVVASISADAVAGVAPLTVKFTSGAIGSGGGKVKGDWAFAPRAPGRPAMPAVETSNSASATKTFDQPGIYDAWLKVKAGSDEDIARMTVLVTAQALPSGRPAALVVEGNGVFLADGDTTPSAFDGTDFCVPSAGTKSAKSIEHTFLLHNMGDSPLALGKAAITISGEGAASFALLHPPRSTVEPQGSSRLVVRFLPKAPGLHAATIEIKSGATTIRFGVRGGAP